MNLKILIFILFAATCLTAAGYGYYQSQALKFRKAGAGSFGITPPYVRHEHLKPGDVYEQRITVMRGDESDQEAVEIQLNAPEIASWFEFEPRLPVPFFAGKERISVTVRVNVPGNARPGKYIGNLGFGLSANANSGGVGIGVGALADIDLTVEADVNDGFVEAGERATKFFEARNEEFYSRLKGMIIIKTEDSGRAYYVHPRRRFLFSLGSPANSLEVMAGQGIGISDRDLERIPGDKQFSENQSGRILIQTEGRGEAWYVYPLDFNRYYLGKPADALSVLKKLGLGVSNADFEQIIK